MKKTKIILAALAVSLILLAGCTQDKAAERTVKRNTLFIGIDVSASFTGTPYFADSIKFISYYIYGHIHGLGGLKQPKALFVATIGGFSPDEPKSFRPIQDFEDKTVEQIEHDLKTWLVPHQTITDFNAFFERVKELIQVKNLILTPIDIVILTDGEPSKLTKNGRVVMASYKDIDLSSLDYLAKTITVRLLYPTPVVEAKWQKLVPRSRVRMWSQDNEVMEGWKSKYKEGVALESQDSLWSWIKDNIDYRVRYSILSIKTDHK
jgi:hypothetical protein